MCSHRLNLISPVKYNYKIMQSNVNTCTYKRIQNQVTEISCRMMYVQILTLEDCLHTYTSTYTSSNVQLWEQEEKHNFDFWISALIMRINFHRLILKLFIFPDISQTRAAGPAEQIPKTFPRTQHGQRIQLIHSHLDNENNNNNILNS